MIYLMSDLGTEIKRRRVALGMSQGDLAQACGLAVSSVHGIEMRGNPTCDTLAKLAVVLGPFQIPCVYEWHPGTPDTADVGVYIAETRRGQMVALWDGSQWICVEKVDRWRLP